MAAPPAPRDAPFAGLGLERTGPDLVAVDEFGRTSAAGIYAAGDLVATAPSVVQALATGQRAAVGVTRVEDPSGKVLEESRGDGCRCRTASR